MGVSKLLLGGLLAGAALSAASCATPPPVDVSSTFVDRVPAATQAKAQAKAKVQAQAKAQPKDGAKGEASATAAVFSCHVAIAEAADMRREPQLLGIVGGRAVNAPDDTTAWLTSILGGLQARGVGVAFDKDATPTGDVVVARVNLRSAWLTSVSTNKVANVVLHVRAERAGAPVIERDYRGSLTGVNWSSGEGELRRLVDDAFADALNDMAVDFHTLCKG
jgi:hypothetical protein